MSSGSARPMASGAGTTRAISGVTSAPSPPPRPPLDKPVRNAPARITMKIGISMLIVGKFYRECALARKLLKSGERRQSTALMETHRTNESHNTPNFACDHFDSDYYSGSDSAQLFQIARGDPGHHADQHPAVGVDHLQRRGQRY